MSLHYEFPYISHISDVLPHIDESFRVVEKNGLTFINYMMMGNEVFPPVVEGSADFQRARIRRECRGIVFDTATGALVSRPFHKFFNAGERADMALDMINLGRPHAILEKLDGSMLRPLFVGGHLRWGTKMGLTDVAMLAEEHIADKPQYARLAQWGQIAGVTLLFEFCSRRSRIVVDYEEEVMVLLAVRNNFTGKYFPRASVVFLANSFDVPVVDHTQWDGKRRENAYGMFTGVSAGDLLGNVKDYENGEGLIVAFEDGHCVKMKSDHYVRIHRAKDMIRSERRVLELVLEDELDDLLPILDASDRDNVLRYVGSFNDEVFYRVGDLQSAYDRMRRVYATKKDYAISKDAKTLSYPAWMRPMIFALWDGKAATERDAVMKSVRSGMVSETRFAEMKKEIGLNTKWDRYEMEEAA